MMNKPNNNQQMKAFINALLEEYYPDCGDIDGATFQELGEKHGILIPETRYEPCGEFCNCNTMVYDEEWKEGVKCYRAAPWLSAQQVEPSGAGELLKQHERDTRQLAQLVIERQALASKVNSLANIILGLNASDNERDEADEAIEKVLPLL